MQMPIVLNHVFAWTHWRQCDIGLEFGHVHAREQRQIVFITAALERADSPQGIATVETERAKRVGPRQFFQA